MLSKALTFCTIAFVTCQGIWTNVVCDYHLSIVDFAVATCRFAASFPKMSHALTAAKHVFPVTLQDSDPAYLLSSDVIVGVCGMIAIEKHLFDFPRAFADFL